MNKTTLEDDIERLAVETRKAKHDCLAFFASIAVSAEELRQMREDAVATARMMAEVRDHGVVNLREYRNLFQIHSIQITQASLFDSGLRRDSESTLVYKLAKYWGALDQLNRYQTELKKFGQIIEFSHDQRRSNHPPTP